MINERTIAFVEKIAELPEVVEVEGDVAVVVDAGVCAVVVVVVVVSVVVLSFAPPPLSFGVASPLFCCPFASIERNNDNINVA